MEKYITYLVEWLQIKVKEAHASGLIVGVSGGIDSAVVANLIKRAFPNDSLGIIMPCYSSAEDVNDAKLVVKEANLKYHEINLDKTFDILIAELESDSEVSKEAKANTKARLRMSTLYALAQSNNYLVVGTDNACEWYTGYFTKYGDGGVDIAPLVHLTKSQVYEMARILGINQKIIDKIPSAGLIDNQSDEDEMQVTYVELEAYLNNEEVSQKAKARIEQLHQNSEHKRKIIAFPECEVSEVK
ncbi:NAD(+) synthase [Erysipelotrichaceae bacterium OttesenSCG-928-M19]|nr:NAD(+) synthase [Erysipelotrichaceae bacterium OttesenSCG-928-M19]